jgi:hypothetical protein
MADVKISALPAAASALATDQHPVNQGGTTKRLTNTQISDFIKAVAPAISLNAGVAFGVQQNNASTRTMVVIVTINMAYDHTSPGNHQVTIVTNATTPNPMAFVALSGGVNEDISSGYCMMAIVAPGGFYRIDDAQDPDGGNSINSVWEILL